jgi:acyl-CoA reductase-like NAD-dependent aldehyde dehydrogenase
MPSGRLDWSPVGVVGMIGTWNYPLFLSAPPIAQALAAGNAVVWKPSELAVRTSQKLQQSLEESGLPPGLVTAVFGGAALGRALMEADLDKGMFTGGIENGRRVLSLLGARGIPAVAELSGFDPAIILPDAPRHATVKALTWAAFVGCGQTCVAVKRVYVVGDATPWAEALASQAKALNVGDPCREEIDLGPMISEAARARFDGMIKSAVQAGARTLTGGTALAGPGWFYAPTVLAADNPEAEEALAGAFGPVILVRGVADTAAAVAAANASRFALGASVWGRNRKLARSLARQLQAGMVCVNEAVTPTAHAAAPFGGCKASGYGRTHGSLGLREFTSPRVLFDRRAGGFRPQLFPYSKTRTLERFLAAYLRMFHPRA